MEAVATTTPGVQALAPLNETMAAAADIQRLMLIAGAGPYVSQSTFKREPSVLDGRRLRLHGRQARLRPQTLLKRALGRDRSRTRWRAWRGKKFDGRCPEKNAAGNATHTNAQPTPTRTNTAHTNNITQRARKHTTQSHDPPAAAATTAAAAELAQPKLAEAHQRNTHTHTHSHAHEHARTHTHKRAPPQPHAPYTRAHTRTRTGRHARASTHTHTPFFFL